MDAPNSYGAGIYNVKRYGMTPRTFYSASSLSIIFVSSTLGTEFILAPTSYGAGIYGAGRYGKASRTFYGWVSLPIIFTSSTSGIEFVIYAPNSYGAGIYGAGRYGKTLRITLNQAKMIYLGSKPVVAVYTDNQKVWPIV